MGRQLILIFLVESKASSTMSTILPVVIMAVFLSPLQDASIAELPFCPTELSQNTSCYPGSTDIMKKSEFLCLRPKTDAKSWSDALGTCRNFGSHLAMLDSPKNCPIVLSNLIEYLNQMSVDSSIWVGGHMDGEALWWEWDVPQPFLGNIAIQPNAVGKLTWEAGHPNTTVGSCVSARYNSNAKQYILRMTDCSTQLHFICMTKTHKKKFLHKGSPTIVKDPEDRISISRPPESNSQLLRKKRQSTTTATDEYTLTCEADNYHPDLPVVWIKDGAYIDNGKPLEGGFTFHIKHISFPKARAKKMDELQGTYSCEVWGVKPDFKRVRSRAALVTFAGVATMRSNITVNILPLANNVGGVERAKQYMRQHSLCFKLTNSVYSVYQSPYRDFITSAFYLSSDYGGEYIVDGVRQIVDNSTHFILRVSAYYDWFSRLSQKYSKLADDNNSNIANIEVSVAGRSETISSFKSGVIHRALVQHVLSESFSKKVNSKDFKFEINRSDACNEQTFNISEQSFTLLTTRLPLGRGVTELNSSPSRETCPFERTPLAEGQCIGSFITGGRWTIKKMNECNHKIKEPSVRSPVTSELRKLAQKRINAENVLFVANDLANLTRKHQQMNFVDLIHASTVIDNIADLTEIPTQVGKSLISTIDHIGNVDEKTMLEAQEKNNAASRIVSAMDKFSGNVKLDSSGQWSLHGSNVDLLVADRTSAKQVYGAGLTNSFSGLSLYNQLMEVTDSVEAAIMLSQEALSNSELVQSLLLPGELGKKQDQGDAPVRISFTVHRNAALFPVLSYSGCLRNEFQYKSVDSFIVSATISGVSVNKLKNPIKIVLKTKNAAKTLQNICAYWDHNERSSTWFWSNKHLHSNETMLERAGQFVCYSKHLTNFAVIAGYIGNDPVLNAVSIIGLVLSIIGLILTIFSHLAFRLWQDRRRSRSQLVLLHLSISLLFVDLIVIGGLDRTGSSAGCMLVAALLHYFLLVSFSWMLIEGVLQYLKFVKVFDTYSSHFMYKTTIPAWICPGLIVGLVATIDVQQFRGPERYCWLAKEAFYAAFLLPLALIMITNLVLFIVVIKSVTCDRLEIRSTQKKEELIKFQVLLGVCSSIVMGLAWLTAFLAIDTCTHFSTVMHYLFCILNSTQGFLIFLFLNVREKQVRDGWKNLLSKCCPCIEITTISPPVQEGKPVAAKQKRITLNTKRFTLTNAKRTALTLDTQNKNSNNETGGNSSIEVATSNDTTDTSISNSTPQNYYRMNFRLRQP